MISHSTFKLTLVLSLAALAIGGCNKSTGPLISAPVSPIADIPVPAGFAMDASKSNSTVVPATSFRTAYHYYKGSDDVLPVVNFYRTQMPTKGWTLVDQNQMKNEVTLRFSKSKEAAAITIRKALIKTHIIVKLGPSDGTTTNAAKN